MRLLCDRWCADASVLPVVLLVLGGGGARRQEMVVVMGEGARQSQMALVLASRELPQMVVVRSAERSVRATLRLHAFWVVVVGLGLGLGKTILQHQQQRVGAVVYVKTSAG